MTDRAPSEWLIREVDADLDFYDVEQDGRSGMVDSPLMEVERFIEDFGQRGDTVHFEDRNGYRVEHDFRDPPRWLR